MQEIIYREPGAGAILFAEGFTEGMDEIKAEQVLKDLLRGMLHDVTDKGIKRCVFCGYYWRDGSRNNTKKTCSKDCHTRKKSIQRNMQRERKRLLEPEKETEKKHTSRDDYIDWLEYPYWLSEKSMLLYDSNYMTKSKKDPIELIEYVLANRQTYGEGNSYVSKKKVE